MNGKRCVLTNIPGGGTFHLLATYEVPDAGHPVGQQGEHGHQQREHHGAVLRVALQLLQQAQQPQQPDGLQQVDTKVLRGETQRPRRRQGLSMGQKIGAALHVPLKPTLSYNFKLITHAWGGSHPAG